MSLFARPARLFPARVMSIFARPVSLQTGRCHYLHAPSHFLQDGLIICTPRLFRRRAVSLFARPSVYTQSGVIICTPCLISCRTVSLICTPCLISCRTVSLFAGYVSFHAGPMSLFAYSNRRSTSFRIYVVYVWGHGPHHHHSLYIYYSRCGDELTTEEVHLYPSIACPRRHAGQKVCLCTDCIHDSRHFVPTRGGLLHTPPKRQGSRHSRRHQLPPLLRYSPTARPVKPVGQRVQRSTVK